MKEKKETKKETLLVPIIGRVILIFARRQAPFSRSRHPPPIHPLRPAPFARPSRVGNQYEYAREARSSLNCPLAREESRPRENRAGRRERVSVARASSPLPQSRRIDSVVTRLPSPLEYICRKGGPDLVVRGTRVTQQHERGWSR